MSNDVPPSAPGSPEPDPFAELLKGLINEPASETPAQAAPGPDLPPTEAMPLPTEPELPPTEAMPAAELPNTTFPPTAAFPPPAAFPATEATRLFPQAGAEQPTELLGGLAGFGDIPPEAPTSAWSLDDGGDGPREPLDLRRKVIVGILIAVAAILVVAIAVLVTILAIGKGNETPAAAHSSSHASVGPSPSDTPSDSPSPSATAEPPAIANFVADSTTVQCPYDRSGTQPVVLSWSATGATNVALASTAAPVDDATQQPFENNLDASASGFSIPYTCTNAKWFYTLTIVGADGSTTSQSIEVDAAYAAPPQPKPTPTPTPTPSGTLDVDTSHGTVADLCSAAGGAGRVITLTFKWATSNTSDVRFGLDSNWNDAVEGPSPAIDIEHTCGQSQTYYLFDAGTVLVAKTLSD